MWGDIWVVHLSVAVTGQDKRSFLAQGFRGFSSWLLGCVASGHVECWNDTVWSSAEMLTSQQPESKEKQNERSQGSKSALTDLTSPRAHLLKVPLPPQQTQRDINKYYQVLLCRIYSLRSQSHSKREASWLTSDMIWSVCSFEKAVWQCVCTRVILVLIQPCHQQGPSII